MKRVTILSALVLTLGFLLGVSGIEPVPQSNNDCELMSTTESFFSEGICGNALVSEVPSATAAMPQASYTHIRQNTSSYRIAEAVRRSPLQILHRTSPTAVRSVQNPLSDNSPAADYYIFMLRKIVI